MSSYWRQTPESFENSPVVQDNPGVALGGLLADREYPTDPMDFFKRFGVSYEAVKTDGYAPLFLALTQSGSGEEAESFGLFKKEGKKGVEYFEVSGTECSMWDFNGQWDPELTTPAAVWHRLTQGHLGLGEEGHDAFNSALKAVVVKLDPSLESKMESAAGGSSRKNSKSKKSRGPK